MLAADDAAAHVAGRGHASRSPRQLAAHLVALPQAQAGGLAAASCWSLFYLVAVFADFLAYADPDETDAQRSLIAAAADPLVRRRRLRSPYVYRAERHARPAHLQARLRSRPEPEALPVALFGRGYAYSCSGPDSRPTAT